jgi:hypothetical protein
MSLEVKKVCCPKTLISRRVKNKHFVEAENPYQSWMYRAEFQVTFTDRPRTYLLVNFHNKGYTAVQSVRY